MITLKKIVSLALDIKDINDAVILFLKEKGFETSDIVTEDNLLELVRGGALVLNAKEVTSEETLEKSQGNGKEEKTQITFSDSIISRVGSCTMGLEMFLHHVEAHQVQMMLKRNFFGKLGNPDKNLLTFIFNLNLVNPGARKIKNPQEIEEYFQSNGKLNVKKVLTNFGGIVLNDFQVALSNNSLTTKFNLSKEELLKLEVKDMSFSCRTYNALRSNDIETVEQLVNLDFDKFKRTRNTGKTTFQEIRNFLQLYKLSSLSFSIIA